MFPFVAEYSPLSQKNKWAARFCPEIDVVRRGSYCLNLLLIFQDENVNTNASSSLRRNISASFLFTFSKNYCRPILSLSKSLYLGGKKGRNPKDPDKNHRELRWKGTQSSGEIRRQNRKSLHREIADCPFSHLVSQKIYGRILIWGLCRFWETEGTLKMQNKISGRA